MNKSRSLAYIALFTALTAVSAFIRIPFAIPFTLQTLACMVAGLMLPKREAVMSQVLYLALGLIGIPIFTNGGGFAYVLEPTFGYALFLPCACLIINVLNKINLRPTVCAFFAAIALLLFGTTYFALISQFYLGKNTDIGKLMVSCTLIFVPIELVKAVVASLLYSRLKKISILED
ncbi:MAG: biotin transporter BioY [Clostridia bacterium]